ncbi:MAG: response regulator transcription factor [Flavobacteriales bacterium]|nr:response regulator transcription factor [Flavobacteriales bacterium]MCC6937554.1 response regulator transcription factor [Flavobacteriales bacterium]
MPIKLLLADHGELPLLGLRTLFAQEDRVEIVGEARDPIALSALLVRHKPDVVLIDHTAEGFSAKAVRDSLRRLPRVRFVGITTDPSPLALMSALKAGVTSYVKKDCDVQEIRDSVLRTAEGGRFFCGKILETLRRASFDVDRFIAEPMSCDPVVLSKRECEVIGLITEGRSYTRIADQLCLSAHTVTTHRRNIMRKLGVNSTAAVVLYAVRNGLTSPNKYLFEQGR